MTGGGFGGCAVALVRTANVADVAEGLAARYREGAGRVLTTFVTHPARGAHLVAAGGPT
jgi:galactokinase